MRLRSPKLHTQKNHVSSVFYPYYAGYSAEFVEDVLNILQPEPDTIVVDPWNGTGTTTSVANQMGYAATGYDLNPVMVIVAKARHITIDFKTSVLSLGTEIVESAKTNLPDLVDNDPLKGWFTPAFIQQLRAIQHTVERFLYPKGFSKSSLECWNQLSHIAAFYTTAMFRTVKNAFHFRQSNPTWIKFPEEPVEPAVSIWDLYMESLHNMEQYLHNNNQIGDTSVRILLSNSKQIPLSGESVGCVISSPPYLTRIDYLKATWLELLVLGFNEEQLQVMRKEMLGTPIVRGFDPNNLTFLSETCNRTLKFITEHPSHASSTYYYKTYAKYFADLYRSVSEIERILKKRGKGVLVVQSSYYKELEVPLDQIVQEMLDSLELKANILHTEKISQTLVSVNPSARKYRVNRRYRESAVAFSK